MPVHFDCIVVGAGPSGSTAAGCLAEGGMRVLLLEGDKLPREKLCGGLLSRRAREQIPFDIDYYLTENRKVRDIEYHSGWGMDEYRGRLELGYIIDRRTFDYELSRKAEDLGVEVLDSMKVDSVRQKDSYYIVRSGRYSFSSRYIIGADGSHSIVSRDLGFGTYLDSYFYGFALGVNISSESGIPSRCRIYSLPIPTGLGWCFNGPREMNVGLGACTQFSKRLTKMTEEFISGVRKSTGMDIPFSKLKGGFLKTGGWKRRIAHRGAFLVGDAAGLAEPFSGEGLYAAVMSGREAAGFILNREKGEGENHKEEYSRTIYRRLLKEYRHSIILSLFRRRLEDMGLWGQGYIGAGMIAGIMRGEECYSSINKTLLTGLLNRQNRCSLNDKRQDI
ncbi:MAG: hypothetical protein HPY66_1032 [Firmicutes bacterium]|nr:hypothetical protein [Bacillota bacterium]MDI6706418.1 geranylgeranyl reductase family protein [Bacillota bacterium]